MKKLVYLSFAVVFSIALSVGLSSCGGKDEKNETKPNDKGSSITAPSSTVEPSSTTEGATEEVPSDETSTDVVESSGSDCDSFISEYESFVDEYISFMKKYKNSSSDPSALTSMMSDYSSMMEKAQDMQKRAGDCSDPKYSSKLLELAQKLNSAASGM